MTEEQEKIARKRFRLACLNIEYSWWQKSLALPPEQMFDTRAFVFAIMNVLVGLKEGTTMIVNDECKWSNPDDDPRTRFMDDNNLTRPVFGELLEYLGSVLRQSPMPSLDAIYKNLPKRVWAWLQTPDLIKAASLPD